MESLGLPPELVAVIAKNGSTGLILLWAAFQLREVTKSVKELNDKIGQLLTRQELHGQRLDQHDDRLSKLEVH